MSKHQHRPEQHEADCYLDRFFAAGHAHLNKFDPKDPEAAHQSMMFFQGAEIVKAAVGEMASTAPLVTILRDMAEIMKPGFQPDPKSPKLVLADLYRFTITAFIASYMELCRTHHIPINAPELEMFVERYCSEMFGEGSWEATRKRQ